MALAAVTALAAVLIWRLRSRTAPVEEPTFVVPEIITPFTVLGLLKGIQENNGLDKVQHHELSASIRRLENYYFINSDEDEPDLQTIAQDWASRAKARP